MEPTTEHPTPTAVEPQQATAQATDVLDTGPETERERGKAIATEEFGSNEEFEKALEATLKDFGDGDIVEGVVVTVDPEEVLLDIGYKSEGVIPSRELSIKHDVDPAEVVAIGDVIEALVLQKEDQDGRLILSKKRAQYERAWGKIEEIYETNSTVAGTVIEVVKGGLIIDIGLRGFLPASLVEMRRVRDLHPYVGRELESKVIELDKNRNNVVLSRRKFLEETQSEFRREFLETLQKGEVRKGTVSSIVHFGAFVDLGGVDGLVHVSELSWKHVDHPSDVVEQGNEVEVSVLDVDLSRERVSLSLKATQEDPWRQFARQHYVGEYLDGHVTKLVPFGAFAKIEEGIEGLVHISELADAHVEAPEQVVKVDEPMTVRIIDIDETRRRISLSLKQAIKAGYAAEREVAGAPEAPESAEATPEPAEAEAAPAETAEQPEQEPTPPEPSEPEPSSTVGAALQAAVQARSDEEGEGQAEDAEGVTLESVVASLRGQSEEEQAGEDEAGEASGEPGAASSTVEEPLAEEAGVTEEGGGSEIAEPAAATASGDSPEEAEGAAIDEAENAPGEDESSEDEGSDRDA
jgi:small subunit ribosomal protein S1